jgi:hypothetical protein
MRRFHNLPLPILQLAFACLDEAPVQKSSIFPCALVVVPELPLSSYASLVLLLCL